jgi:hypothetical protein
LARELAGLYIVSLSPATAQEERESPWRSKRPRGAVSPQNPHKQSAAAKTCRFDQARPHPAARSGQRGLEVKDDPAAPAAGRQAAVRLGGQLGGQDLGHAEAEGAVFCEVTELFQQGGVASGVERRDGPDGDAAFSGTAPASEGRYGAAVGNRAEGVT